MRKYLLIILAAIMSFVTACAGSENNNRTDSTPASNVIFSGVSVGIDETSSADAIKSQESDRLVNEEETALSIEIIVGGRTFSAALYDNETARAFKNRLPLTLDMSELNGNEKYCNLSDSLPRNSSRPSRINSGDIMLYGSDCLVIFYESFSTSYSYTPIGKIDDPDGLAEALGSESVQVIFN